MEKKLMNEGRIREKDSLRTAQIRINKVDCSIIFLQLISKGVLDSTVFSYK